MRESRWIFVSALVALAAGAVTWAVLDYANKPAQAAVASPPAVHFVELPVLHEGARLYAARTPEGWLVWGRGGGLTYVPDPDMKWGPAAAELRELEGLMPAKGHASR